MDPKNPEERALTYEELLQITEGVDRVVSTYLSRRQRSLSLEDLQIIKLPLTREDFIMIHSSSTPNRNEWPKELSGQYHDEWNKWMDELYPWRCDWD